VKPAQYISHGWTIRPPLSSSSRDQFLISPEYTKLENISIRTLLSLRVRKRRDISFFLGYVNAMLAITGASGKIGGATLDAILERHLIPVENFVCLTSSREGDQKWNQLVGRGVQVRHATFDDPESMRIALQDCKSLLLVSSPRIAMDFYDAPPGKGREKDHYVAIDAALSAGVKHIYYTSLAFRSPSKSNVMTAHERTEAYFREQSGVSWTFIREGIYSESWPLYLGHYNFPNDERSEIVIAGDGLISWTSIPDLGLATAHIVAAPPEEYANKVVQLSNTQNPMTIAQVAELVSAARAKPLKVKKVTRDEHERYYIEKRAMDRGLIEWWATSYDAIEDGELSVHDTTLEKLLKAAGREPKPMQQTVQEMFRQTSEKAH
jgi:uncharacterized protein YbjT (DUF2867 family)